MAELEVHLTKLLAGDVVPVGNIDISHKPGGKVADGYVPLTKESVGYIAMGVVFDDQDRILLIQEAKARIRGLWYIPAGRVEPGENLVDGVKREVLEEAGLEIEPITFCCLEMYGSLNWYRFVYAAKATGGRLKTLEQQDKESMQAQWFPVKDVLDGKVKLRAKDFFKAMMIVRQYLSASDHEQHPSLQIGIQSHRHLLLRPLLVKKNSNGSVDVLCRKLDFCLPVIQLRERDRSLSEALYYLYRDVFNISEKDRDLWLTSEGLLTLEHCGIPAGEHDGICITAVYIVPEEVHMKLRDISNKEYMWKTINEQGLLEGLQRRVFTGNMLVPIVG